MKKVMIGLLLASAAAATPAQARDGSWYAGIEGGAMWVKDQNFNYSYDYDFVGPTGGDGFAVFTGTTDFDSEIDYSTGTDVDLIAGYDFGMFRAELELGYKHATHERYKTNALGVPDYYDVDGDYYTNFYDLDTTSEGYGKTNVYSAMVNLLFDAGNQDGFSFYAGPGVGLASTKITVQDRGYETNNFSIKDSGLALQGIAGVRYALSPNLDVGLKYRYFYGNKISDDFDAFDQDVDVDVSRFKSHSLLASLVYNFASPPPPVVEVVAPAPMPEPAPAPQMQTCYDGSMIPVTAMCPQPPAPVVAPAPMPGERG